MKNHSKKEKHLAKIVNYRECVISFQTLIKALKINLSNNHLPEQFLLLCAAVIFKNLLVTGSLSLLHSVFANEYWCIEIDG